MKKHIYTVALLTTTALTSQAQWLTTGNTITPTSYLGSPASTNTLPILFKINGVQVASMAPTVFTVANGLTLSSYTGTGVRLLQIGTGGVVSPLLMGTAAQYLNGAGAWTAFPTQFFLPSGTASNTTTNTGIGVSNATEKLEVAGNVRVASALSIGNATNTFTSIPVTLNALLAPTHQGGILVNMQNNTFTNAYGIKTITKDNQYAITNTGTYLDDNGTPITAQNFTVNNKGVVDATNYTQNGVTLGAWKQLTNGTVESYLSYNTSPVSIGTTNSPAQSLRTFVSKNDCAALLVTPTSYYNTQLLNMEGNNPTLIFRDNGTTPAQQDKADLLIGAADGAARFVTNDGFAFFMNADNKTPTTTSFNGFKILKESPFFGCNQKEVLLLQPDGEFTIRGNTIFNTTTGDNKLLQLSNAGRIFNRGIDVSVASATDKGFVLHNDVSQKDEFVVKGNGHVFAREVEIFATGVDFPDYVFEKNYKLNSLTEVENYIKINKHLPNIPSAKDVQDKGSISLTEMNLKLLEKIEELTLYMIAQNKRIAELEKLNK